MQIAHSLRPRVFFFPKDSLLRRILFTGSNDIFEGVWEKKNIYGKSTSNKVNKCRRIGENDSDTRWLFRCDLAFFVRTTRRMSNV